MSLSLPSAARIVVVALLLGAALSACGRKGPLEPPPGAAGEAKPDPLSQQNESATPGVKTLVPTVTPVGSRRGKPITPPKDDFILDPIL
ncbi:LPS translocon maturation chaperone LptM [Alsobacter sp. R-9]